MVSPQRSENIRNAALAVVTTLGVLLAVSNWWLSHENRRLRSQVTFYDSMGHTRLGVKLPSIHGKDLEGRDVLVDYQLRTPHTLLFVFSPLCHFCKLNWPTWSEISKNCAETRIVFANIKGELNNQFLQQYPFGPGIALASVDPRSILDYQFRETPATLLLGPDGISQAIWRGVIGDSDLRQLKKDIGCQVRVSGPQGD